MLRRDSQNQLVGPDPDKGILFGLVAAEVGEFFTGRGRFNAESLRQLSLKTRLALPPGLPARFRHPVLGVDPLGTFVGRVRNPRVDGPRLRVDLHIDPTALQEPIGGGRPFGKYILQLADTDPRAFGASYVLSATKTVERDARGRALRDAGGAELPPVWYPQELSALDLVSMGDATFRSGALCVPYRETDAELRARNDARKALYGYDDELLRARNRNRKRKLQVGIN